jgi:hypothetical protein
LVGSGEGRGGEQGKLDGEKERKAARSKSVVEEDQNASGGQPPEVKRDEGGANEGMHRGRKEEDSEEGNSTGSAESVGAELARKMRELTL